MIKHMYPDTILDDPALKEALEKRASRLKLIFSNFSDRLLTDARDFLQDKLERGELRYPCTSWLYYINDEMEARVCVIRMFVDDDEMDFFPLYA